MEYDTPKRTFTAKVESNGRIVIPAAVRETLGLVAGDEVTLLVEGDDLIVRSRRAAVRRVRERLAAARPPEVTGGGGRGRRISGRAHGVLGVDAGRGRRSGSTGSACAARKAASRNVNVTCLLDASVLLAVAFNEVGANEALQVLARPRLGIVATNLAEVVSKLRQRGMTMAGCRAFIADLQLTVVSPDTETALLAGELHANTRSVGLSMGDALCLAMAAQLGAKVVTADRAWARLEVGVAIEVIR